MLSANQLASSMFRPCTDDSDRSKDCKIQRVLYWYFLLGQMRGAMAQAQAQAQAGLPRNVSSKRSFTQ